MIISNSNTIASLKRLLILIIAGIISFSALSFSKGENETGSEPEFIYEYGKASYYGHPFIGRKTANGEIFTEHLYTCAHKTLPFGTKLKVTNLRTGAAIIVKVNDRGPFVKHRIVDLSLKGAKELGMMGSGVANVSIEIVNSKYSSLGNVKNMERVLVHDIYAYVDKDDESKMRNLLNFIDSKEVEKTNEVVEDYTAVQNPVNTYTKEGTNHQASQLVME